MDFFHQQDQAHRKTSWFIGYFVVATILIILAVHVAVSLIFFAGTQGRHRHQQTYLLENDGTVSQSSRRSGPMGALGNLEIFGWASLGTLALILGGSLWRFTQLAGGGASVASMLGGRPINSSTTDPDERKVLNVVEEMAIASGVPVPKVYLLAREKGINAFAAGYKPGDAVIGVTQGCVRLLTRDELQGVVAHEFSHILNGDMRLNIRLIAWIFGIMGLALVGRVLLEMRSRSSRDKNPLPLLGLALLLIGWIGVFFGRLIQSAVSRQREYLADASATQFTRNPEGLAGALKKIGGLAIGSRLESPRAAEVGHLFFANGLGSPFFSLFATHPPVSDRIRALDPAFDGQFPATRLAEDAAPAPTRRRADRPAPAIIPLPNRGAFPLPPMIPALAMMDQVGQPTAAHLHYAAGWRDALPASISAAAHEPMGASVLMYGLLLDADDAVRARQLEALSAIAGDGVAQETQRLWPDIVAAANLARLPLVDMALPALSELSPDQFQRFDEAVQSLIEADEQISLFEYVLQKIVMRHLRPRFGHVRRSVTQYYALKPLLPDCALLLGLIAQAGHDTPAEIAIAFRAGWRQLGADTPVADESVLETTDLSKLDVALVRLDQASPLLKKQILNAAAQTVAADGAIKEEEAELLRAIADTLDCPIPPFIQLAVR